MKDLKNQEEATRLAHQGYAITSRASCGASRIDRPDWREHMAEQHSPWNIEGGKRWVGLLGYRGAADHYRRCHSKDHITVTEAIRKEMPKSGDCKFGYRSKESDIHKTFYAGNVSIALWANEAWESIKLYEKWRDITMEKVIKCFHLNDQNFNIGAKQGGVYPERTKKFWGHCITNKAKRLDGDFAWLIDPEGRKAHSITHAMFNKLAASMRHEYIRCVSNEEFTAYLEMIPSLSKLQITRLVDHLDSHPNIQRVKAGEPWVRKSVTIHSFTFGLED